MKSFFLGISLKITSSLCKMKSKATIGVKNTAHYTHSLYILLRVMEIFNTILFVSSLMITTTIQILFIKYKQSLLINLKKTFQLWIRSSNSLKAVLNNIRTAKTLICVIISKIAKWMLNRYSLQLIMASHHAMVLVDLLNVVKHSLQRPLHDQILTYQSMLDLCVRRIPSIIFFGVSQEEMVNVHADLEDRFAKSKTVSEQRVATILFQYLATKLQWVSPIWFWQIIDQRNRYENITCFSYFSCIYDLA